MRTSSQPDFPKISKLFRKMALIDPMTPPLCDSQSDGTSIEDNRLEPGFADRIDVPGPFGEFLEARKE
jgi:hypothetical protein